MMRTEHFGLKKCILMQKQDFNNKEWQKYLEAKKYLNKISKKLNIKTPYLYVDNKDILQASNFPHVSHAPIILYKRDLDHENNLAIQGLIGHEIGHKYAPKIIKRHHLLKRSWQTLFAEYQMPSMIIGIIIMITMDALSFSVDAINISPIISNTALIISDITFAAIIIPDILVHHNKKCQKMIAPYKQENEIIADEFSAWLDHSPKASLVELKQRYQYYLKDLHPTSEFDRQLDKKALSYEYNKSTYIHPSDKIRKQKVIEFCKSGYKDW